MRSVFHFGLLLVATSAFVGSAVAADTTPPTVSTSDNEIQSKRQSLKAQLTTLKRIAKVSQDHWADADVFVKAVDMAIEFESPLDAKHRQKILALLERADERTKALDQGKTPWADRRGATVRGFISRIDGSTQPYGLVVPASYDNTKSMRLDVVLHGSRRATGFGEMQFMEQFDRGDTGAPQKVPNTNFIEVHPLGRLGENAYRFEGETDVDEAIEAVARQFNIDGSRIVLRGGSLGGVGSWQLGLKRPDRWAAVGPAAGPVDTYVFAGSAWKHFVRLDPLTPWQETTLHLVDAIDYTANAGMVPVVASMGDKDPYYTSHQLIEREFHKEGLPFAGLVDKGAGHSITSKVAQEQLGLLGIAAARGTDPAPRDVRFVTWTLKFNRCYWVELLGLDSHYRRAEFQAKLAPDGSVLVTKADNITRFAISSPILAWPSATMTIGDARIEIPAQTGVVRRKLVFERRNEIWTCAGNISKVTLTGKRPGLQGPIDDAFATPFLCVRGTGEAWNPQVGKWADAQLKRFTYEWRRHYRGTLPVKNDTEVTPEDLRDKNLILFGDPGSNRWIREIAPKLAIGWTREKIQLKKSAYAATNHGLQLISPNPLAGAAGRYVVFNSGHTYHDQELRFSYMVFPRLGDWAISKVGEGHAEKPVPTVSESIVTSGFFNEAWSE